MTKKDIVSELHKEIPHISHRIIRQAVDLFFEELKNCLAEEGTVELRGFGNFRCKRRAAYTGMNPKTQERIPVSSKKIVIFRPSCLLKRELITKPKEKKKFFSEIYKDWSQFKR
ncbi:MULTISPECIES: HU family DNA-binding protein [Holospora]|uniref:Integration host factor subunit alpha n=2 Tax=Holospora TaxID=44747 RepID=A0A061JH89_9PROT|nr:MULTISPECIES: HU family DNA-binding protein [Holospora]ETZ04578.1 integration host factor subunit alpha [Holospora undulata HU1]GAJ45967.1 integration host factor subunit alpha [Holospora elegans E1]